MPPEITDEEDMEVGSSTTSTQDATADAAATAALADTATSSAATDETELDTLSVVRDVVEQRETVEAETASSAEGEEVGDTAGGQAPKAGADPDDYSDVPFHKHPRFQQVVAEKNAFKADSTEYRKITSFLDDNALTVAEAADGIEIMALMKLDPVKAWEALKPRIQNLLIAAGEVLPDDLAKRVEAKEISRDDALKISRAQAALKIQETRQQFDRQRGERQQQRDVGASLTTAASTWEADRQLKDPNFAAKLPRIQEKLAFLHNVKRERPTDAAGVTAQLKAVYAEVNKELKAPVAAAQVPGARPAVVARKPAISPVRGGQVASSAAAPSTPKSTLEIVRAGRQRQSA